jgi:hypothetical protein
MDVTIYSDTMKITTSYLNQIIKEEIELFLELGPGDYMTPSGYKDPKKLADPKLQAWLLKQKKRKEKTDRVREYLLSIKREEEEEEEKPKLDKPWWKRWEE